MSVKYDTFHAEKSLCKSCARTLLALVPDIDQPVEKIEGHSSFYVCWDCRKIYQVAAGELTVVPSGIKYEED
jgi:uncharacterized protein with PIN domain